MTDRTQTPLAGLGLDAAIHLRWVLRDVRGKRTQFMPANPDDLRVLAEMGLIEMRELVPTITSEGGRALCGKRKPRLDPLPKPARGARWPFSATGR
jgi:hypothetical protein